MAEYIYKPTTKNRGFYVRMRLLHKTRPPPEKSLFFRYNKWVIWISLSLYFFNSYFISHKPIPRSKIPTSNLKSVHHSRTLFESDSINGTFLESRAAPVQARPRVAAPVISLANQPLSKACHQNRT